MRLALLSAVLVAGAAAVPPTQQLHELVDSGALTDLHWPNFTNLQPDVARFYESNTYQFAWTQRGDATPQAQALIHVLENASLKGLDPEDYDGSRWNGRLLHLWTEPEAVRFDLALTVSVMRYISDVSSGRVDPAVFSFGLHFDQKKCDLAEAVRALINSRNVVADLNQLEPPFEGYWRTQQALARYLALAREDTDPPGLPRVERLLRLVGDLGPNDTLVDGVKRFQIRHGIEPDGRIGKDTLQTIEHAAQPASSPVATGAGALALGPAFLPSAAHRREHSGIPAARLRPTVSPGTRNEGRGRQGVSSQDSSVFE